MKKEKMYSRRVGGKEREIHRRKEADKEREKDERLINRCSLVLSIVPQ